jgi:hypothetical protein
MPEYCQIQMAIKCTEQEYRSTWERFEKLLSTFGYDHKILLSELFQSSWPVDEEVGGDILLMPALIGSDQVGKIACAGLEVQIRTEPGTPFVEEGWVILNILFEAEQIRTASHSQYIAGVGRILWFLMEVTSRTFGGWGVYLTDEWQEGRTIYSLTSGSNDGAIWNFDLALIPFALVDRFSRMPQEFERTDLEAQVGFAQRERWLRLPWG